ncbi:MAG: hypothetical protein WCL50_14810 [Spirochaetota bacterium]
MKYRGFNEAPLLEAVKDLEDQDLPLAQIYPIVNLAGVKWRSDQAKESRPDEILDSWDSSIFQSSTIAFMNSTMKENQKLAKLGHTKEFDRFMLLAIGLSFNTIITAGSPLVMNWLKDGDTEKRRIVLAFAMGSYILVDSDAIDVMIHRIVHARYENTEIASFIIATIHSLGSAGHACLNSIPDTRSV